MKAALLEGDPHCLNLVASSVYDTKPVHYLSMVEEVVEPTISSFKLARAPTIAQQDAEFVPVKHDYNNRFN